MIFRILIILCTLLVSLSALGSGALTRPCLAASDEAHQVVDMDTIFTSQGTDSSNMAMSGDIAGLGTAISASVLFICIVITATCGRQMHRVIENRRQAFASMANQLDQLIDDAVTINTREYERMMDELAALEAQEEELARQLEDLEIKEVSS